jgi:hypothetical protein
MKMKRYTKKLEDAANDAIRDDMSLNDLCKEYGRDAVAQAFLRIGDMVSKFELKGSNFMQYQPELPKFLKAVSVNKL